MGMLPRRGAPPGRQSCAAPLEGVQHGRGAGRVVVLEGAIVVLVEVPGFVLAIEVAKGLQQESALLLEVGEGVEIDGLLHDRSSSRSTRARSSGDTATPGRARHRRKATPSPARAQIRAATGSTHTRLATPDDLGFSRMSSP